MKTLTRHVLTALLALVSINVSATAVGLKRDRKPSPISVETSAAITPAPRIPRALVNRADVNTLECSHECEEWYHICNKEGEYANCCDYRLDSCPPIATTCMDWSDWDLGYTTLTAGPGTTLCANYCTSSYDAQNSYTFVGCGDAPTTTNSHPDATPSTEAGGYLDDLRDLNRRLSSILPYDNYPTSLSDSDEEEDDYGYDYDYGVSEYLRQSRQKRVTIVVISASMAALSIVFLIVGCVMKKRKKKREAAAAAAAAAAENSESSLQQTVEEPANTAPSPPPYSERDPHASNKEEAVIESTPLPPTPPAPAHVPNANALPVSHSGNTGV